MEKILELNELLKTYMDIDFIYCNDEIGRKINKRIEKQFAISLSLEDLVNKVYKQKIKFEPIKKGENDSVQIVPSNIKELFKTNIANPALELSLENLGYSYEKVGYYIDTEEGKKELGTYNEHVIKFSNIISKSRFLSLLEDLTKKEIDFSKLEYLTWEEVAPALNSDGYASTWKRHNPNIFKNVQSTDGIILCKYLDFTNYQGYKSDEFFPKNISVTINPLEYFYKKLALPEELIIFNESFSTDIKSSIPQLIDENQMIEQILLMVRDEISKKISKYIDLIYDKPYVKSNKDGENGVIKFELNVNNYIDIKYISNLSKLYKLDVPEFTLEGIEAFKKTILETENGINYDIEQNLEYICNEIEENNNIYDELRSIIDFLESINNSDLFDETIIEQLYELMKIYGMLSNIKTNKEGCFKGEKKQYKK